MNLIKYTLLSEGATDASLLPIIDWTFHECGIPLVEGYRAEVWRFPTPARTLSDRIKAACENFPCEVLFIHRDADTGPSAARCREIKTALDREGFSRNLPIVAVVPVRMLEAWLLTDEIAIRYAAGNPNGKAPLHLPQISRIEQRPDPKADLKSALRTASELTGRRLKKFDNSEAFWKIVEYTSSFDSLRKLPAFLRFEASVKRMVATGYNPGFYSELDEVSA